MEVQYKVIHNDIENRLLHLRLELYPAQGKQRPCRVAAVFRTEGQDRRFPLEVQWSADGAGGIAEAQIQLACVFFRPVQGDTVIMTLEGQYHTDWVVLKGASLTYPAEAFPPVREKKNLLWTAGRLLLFGLTVPLLPFFLLHGLLAWYGLVPLDTGENTTRGKKAIFIHANVLTKRISGFGYSRREWKTRLFCFYYDRAARQPVRRGQVLFLSERRVEPGGNLDLIRRELRQCSRDAQHSVLRIEEEYSRATIDRLPVARIRETAEKIAASQMIILEDFYPQLHQLALRKETKVIQLWHACGAFKTFGFSRLGKPGGALQSSPNHRSYSLACVSGSKMIPVYAEAFGIPTGCVKALGVPRTDIFFRREYKKQIQAKIYEAYPRLRGKKVVLFAPTFRGDGNKDAYYPEDRFHPELWMERLPEDYAVVVMQHPFVKSRLEIKEQWKGRLLELSGKETVNDLLFVTDILVTDYSSVIFEAALLKLPMVFYGFDWKEYMKTRDIYGEYTSFIPGPLAETEEELLGCIPKAQQEDGLEDFCSSYLDALDGHSTERIAAWIEACIKGEIQ